MVEVGTEWQGVFSFFAKNKALKGYVGSYNVHGGKGFVYRSQKGCTATTNIQHKRAFSRNIRRA